MSKLFGDDSDSGVEASELREQLDKLLKGLEGGGSMSAKKRNKIRGAIAKLQHRLEELSKNIDTIKQPPHVLDPSDPDVVGQLIADTLLRQDAHSFTELERFYGSGVYAIYYKGDFDAYSAIANTEYPIYVGKADPKSLDALTPEQQGTKLYDRLITDHARSIKKAENLDLDDFECRFLVVRSAWQGTAESYLIDRFRPVWNNEIRICYGFGKHGDAATTRANKRSPWDTLHPGREWAWKEGNIDNEFNAEQIAEKIKTHYETLLGS